MSEMFKTRVRNVGTSLGVLIPKEIAKEMRIKKGEIIEVGILKKDPKKIDKAFGIFKGAKPFEREHIERDI